MSKRGQIWTVSDNDDRELFRGCKTKATRYYKAHGGYKAGLSVGHLIMEKINEQWVEYP